MMNKILELKTSLTAYFLVKGGQVTSGPPIGPLAGPLGINAKKIAEDMNKLSLAYKGLRVLMRLDVNKLTKEYTVSLSSVSVVTKFLKFAKEAKGKGDRLSQIVINHETFDEFIKTISIDKSLSEGEIKSVRGSLKSAGVKIV